MPPKKLGLLTKQNRLPENHFFYIYPKFQTNWYINNQFFYENIYHKKITQHKFDKSSHNQKYIKKKIILIFLPERPQTGPTNHKRNKKFTYIKWSSPPSRTEAAVNCRLVYFSCYFATPSMWKKLIKLI